MTFFADNSAQANRWIRFDVDTKPFVTTDYVINELNIQAKAEPLSADLDTIMSGAGTTDETPRKSRMAMSGSHRG